MKALVFGGIAVAVLGYAWSTRAPADVYAVAPAEAYSRLSSARMPAPDGTTGVFFMLDPSILGNGNDKVTVNATGDMAMYTCDVAIAPEGEGSSKLGVGCEGGGAGDGAAAGIAGKLIRARFIEWVDATMNGRPFDPAKSNSTASGWPEGTIDAGDLADAAGQAVQMDAEARRMVEDAERN